jgi:hypothetical protein
MIALDLEILSRTSANCLPVGQLEIQSGKPETKEIFVDKFSELA